MEKPLFGFSMALPSLMFLSLVPLHFSRSESAPTKIHDTPGLPVPGRIPLPSVHDFSAYSTIKTPDSTFFTFPAAKYAKARKSTVTITPGRSMPNRLRFEVK